jgi:hypothetical protein
MRRLLVLGVAMLAGCSGNHQIVPSSVVGPPVTVLRPDQATVAGTATAAHVVGVPPGPLTLPLTITIPNRGQGELNIDGVLIGGHAGTVSWDGGQPLPLSGTGAIALGQATLDAGSGGLVWHLDGAPRVLQPGSYTAGSSVAIGTGGLGTPVDRASFAVPAGRTGSLVSAGDARVQQPARELSLTGPGSVTLVGNLSYHTATRTRSVHRVTLQSGPFELTLAPSPAGFLVTSLLQGPTSAA